MDTIEDAFGEIGREGSDPFAELEKDTPSESLPEKEPEVIEEDKATEGENTPFHKDPRWIRREEEAAHLREENARISAEVASLKEVTSKLHTPVSIPEWFKELYGENESAWSKYSEREVQREQEIEQRVLQKQEAQRQEAQQETQRWSQWVDEEIAKLSAEGAVFDRNKLIKTMLDYRPTDENNNFDFKKGYEIYKKDEALEVKVAPEHSQARKQLADTATASRKGEKKAKDYMTTADLRNKTLDELINN